MLFAGGVLPEDVVLSPQAVSPAVAATTTPVTATALRSTCEEAFILARFVRTGPRIIPADAHLLYLLAGTGDG
ncbi:hypothetical protein GCM10022235_63510 [Kribbella ginsengisoli]|uniref:Uncharacterized protein n=1 Tax=Kribbella ginsengisoli TaxID=363865 RepID=A0ABP6YKX8_9ACTN